MKIRMNARRELRAFFTRVIINQITEGIDWRLYT